LYVTTRGKTSSQRGWVATFALESDGSVREEFACRVLVRRDDGKSLRVREVRFRGVDVVHVEVGRRLYVTTRGKTSSQRGWVATFALESDGSVREEKDRSVSPR
jgi:hypothetical protein